MKLNYWTDESLFYNELLNQQFNRSEWKFEKVHILSWADEIELEQCIDEHGSLIDVNFWNSYRQFQEVTRLVKKKCLPMGV